MTHPNAELPPASETPTGEATAGVNSARKYAVDRDLDDAGTGQSIDGLTHSAAGGSSNDPLGVDAQRLEPSAELGKHRLEDMPVPSSPRKHLTPRSNDKEFVFPKSTDPQ